MTHDTTKYFSFIYRDCIDFCERVLLGEFGLTLGGHLNDNNKDKPPARDNRQTHDFFFDNQHLKHKSPALPHTTPLIDGLVVAMTPHVLTPAIKDAIKNTYKDDKPITHLGVVINEGVFHYLPREEKVVWTPPDRLNLLGFDIASYHNPFNKSGEVVCLSSKS